MESIPAAAGRGTISRRQYPSVSHNVSSANLSRVKAVARVKAFEYMTYIGDVPRGDLVVPVENGFLTNRLSNLKAWQHASRLLVIAPDLNRCFS